MASTSETVDSETRQMDGLLGTRLRIDIFLAVFIGIVLLTILTRFANLGTRVMSHDETTHVYFSWQLEQGRGYAHDPLSHGPMQFHLLALAYFLFGDSDASARMWAAIAGVVAVLLVWPFRRWIGRLSALVTAGLIFASPFLLYYARYARNEAFVVVEALMMFWAIFSYLERRRASSLYVLAAALSLHFCTKETSFIYAAQLLVLLAVLFLWEAVRKSWPDRIRRLVFFVSVAAAAIGAGMAFVVFMRDRTLAGDAATVIVSPLVTLGVVLAAAAIVVAAVMLVLSFRRGLRTDFPALDLLIITGTLTITQLGAFPSAALGFDPLAYSDASEWGPTLMMVVGLVVLAAAIGLLWNWKRWLIAAGIFAAIYVPLYTTLFTNPIGLATGMVGSLATGSSSKASSVAPSHSTTTCSSNSRSTSILSPSAAWSRPGWGSPRSSAGRALRSPSPRPDRRPMTCPRSIPWSLAIGRSRPWCSTPSPASACPGSQCTSLFH